MSQRINPSLWELPTPIQWACHMKKFFPGPTLWMFKERMNKTPIRKRSPFNPERERETSNNLSHFKGKRQYKFKREMKDLIPR